MSAMERLLKLASPPLKKGPPTLTEDSARLAGSQRAPLCHFLAARNGWYAFENALHVFHAGEAPLQELDLNEWNAPDTWRNAYEEHAEGCLFFAEDVFGGQFCVKDGKCWSFDPEQAVLTHVADDLEGWADAILSDTDFLTGGKLAAAWRDQHGEIQPGKRLAPIKPFVLGGDYTLDNLGVLDAVENMRVRASIWLQSRDLPDGTPVEIDTIKSS